MKRWFTGKDADADKVATLQSMGFDAKQARKVLKETQGNVQEAAERLLASAATSSSTMPSSSSSYPVTSSTTNPTRHSNHVAMSEEEQLQAAMQESLQMEQSRQQTTSSSEPGSMSTRIAGRSAASIRAGQAALERFQDSGDKFGSNRKTLKKKKASTKPASTKSSKSPTRSYHDSKPTNTNVNYKAPKFEHPNVKVPTAMKDKTKEEQILRCTQRLSTNSLAVDTLIRTFRTIRDNPHNDKYRRIDTTNPGFIKALDGVPGAKDLLLAVNFQPRYNNELVLDHGRVDPALLYLAISALEQVLESDEYKDDKNQRLFIKEVKAIQDGATGTNHDQELVQRAAYLSKCPSEPQGGSGALMQLSIGDTKLSRKFDGDDILQDLISWIGAHGTTIPQKLITREWCLVDLNRYPIVPMDVDVHQGKTLQYLGLWPSGKLAIRPSASSWREGKVDDTSDQMGSSRGLNGAPSSVLS